MEEMESDEEAGLADNASGRERKHPRSPQKQKWMPSWIWTISTLISMGKNSSKILETF